MSSKEHCVPRFNPIMSCCW